ncbi:MAG: A/G-specific adenine glycosylase [Anaeromyxobacter sp.]
MTAVAPATAAALRRALLAWYDRARRDLPWRGPRGVAQPAVDPYAAWIAEVMLQQTQVATALPYWRRFLARFPTLEALARAREEDVLAAWSGLGYYARARRLGPAAREALARHGGLPRTLEALLELPGFGPYTAGAVASIAFGVRAPAVDGNAVRVLARLFAVPGDPASPGVKRRLEAIAAALVPARRPGDWNQAVMELGATVCRKPTPACERCPVAPRCLARQQGREGELPPARARAPRRALLVACALDPGADAVALVRRPAGGLFGGLWVLPGVEVRSWRGAEAALGRHLEGLAGPSVRVGRLLAEVDRTLTHRDLRLRAYACELPRTGRVGDSAGLRWVELRDIEGLGVPTATRALLDAALRQAQDRPSPTPRIA